MHVLKHLLEKSVGQPGPFSSSEATKWASKIARKEVNTQKTRGEKSTREGAAPNKAKQKSKNGEKLFKHPATTTVFEMIGLLKRKRDLSKLFNKFCLQTGLYKRSKIGAAVFR